MLDTPPVHLAHAAIWQDHANAAPAVNRFVTKMKESLCRAIGALTQEKVQPRELQDGQSCH